LLSTDQFLITIYNDLEVQSKYRSDLFDLFGSPDGTRRGYLGSRKDPLCWDWGTTGFRKIINIMHTLSGADPNNFPSFYESKIMRKAGIVRALVENGIIDSSPQMLYVFKQGTRKIPAFIATIHDLSWREDTGRIDITFQPTRYMLLDPTAWREFWFKLFTGGREDPQKWLNVWDESWKIPRPTLPQLQRMLHSSVNQDQYHLIPYGLLTDSLQNDVERKQCTFFTKEITNVSKRVKLQVSTDNQILWGLLSEFTGRTQVKGTVELNYHGRYMITNIPANTISEESLVFKQEIGAARTICQVMLDVFGEEYLSIEFGKELTKTLLDSQFLKRASQVSMVAKEYDSEYAETDFDYELRLEPLRHQISSLRRKKILFDLTAGLWNKGIGKNKEEFVAQWQHTLTKLPEANDDLIILWHYGLSTEVRDGSYQGQELGDYIASRANIQITKYSPGAILKSRTPPQLVLLPFFRDSATRLETELNRMSSDNATERRKSNLYGALKELLERLAQKD
jgi:hypothetical protein